MQNLATVEITSAGSWLLRSLPKCCLKSRVLHATIHVPVTPKPLCFIVMPFGRKRDPGGGSDIDFDAIYELGIRPAVDDAGMQPIRADEERLGGIIHKPMLERLLLCDFAVVDLTTSNANVLYELGVRHAVRPATTLCIFAEHQQMPFDVGMVRALPYTLGEHNRFTESEGAALRPKVAGQLRRFREEGAVDAETDSPLFQLLQGYGPPDLSRLKTDVFREQVRYAEDRKKRLAFARRAGDDAQVGEVEASLGNLGDVEAGVLVDLFLSYRAVHSWRAMIDLYERLPTVLQRCVLLREQLGFALNRAGLGDEALEVLEGVLDDQGPSSETCGLIGRVHKDRWIAALDAGNDALAEAHLDRAIASYVRGFEADWRDAYPGINAVTLLEVKGDEPALQKKSELLPVVRFAVTQRLASEKPDYWDYATLLELAVLATDVEGVREYLGKSLAAVRERWEPETTAKNLSLIERARRARGTDEGWLQEAIEALRAV